MKGEATKDVVLRRVENIHCYFKRMTSKTLGSLERSRKCTSPKDIVKTIHFCWRKCRGENSILLSDEEIKNFLGFKTLY